MYICIYIIYIQACTDALCACKRQSSQVSFLSPVLSLVSVEETITCFPQERKCEAIENRVTFFRKKKLKLQEFISNELSLKCCMTDLKSDSFT